MSERVTSYDSFEEAMEAMAEQERRINELISEEQWSITWGDYVVRFHPVDGGDLLVIFGRLHREYEAFMSNARHLLNDEQISECWKLQKELDDPASWEDLEWSRMRAVIRSFGLGDETEMEIIHPHESLRDAHGRGYRYGTWASLLSPRGELRDGHLLGCARITREQYHEAELAEWYPDFEWIEEAASRALRRP